jgi:hypothetical protein
MSTSKSALQTRTIGGERGQRAHDLVQQRDNLRGVIDVFVVKTAAMISPVLASTLM